MFVGITQKSEAFHPHLLAAGLNQTAQKLFLVLFCTVIFQIALLMHMPIHKILPYPQKVSVTSLALLSVFFAFLSFYTRNATGTLN